MQVSTEIKRTAEYLVRLAEEKETLGASHHAGWVPEVNIFNASPLTAQEAKNMNASALKEARECRSIASRLLDGESVNGWMPGDEFLGA